MGRLSLDIDVHIAEIKISKLQNVNSEMNEEFSSNQILTVYHATSKASADSILKCFDEKFEGLINNRKCLGAGFLEADPIHAGGMKAGAAVYFGLDKEYCIEEAVNTMERIEFDDSSIGSEGSSSSSSDSFSISIDRDALREGVVCLEIDLKLKNLLNLIPVMENYDYTTPKSWPFPETSGLLPNGNPYNVLLDREAWDENTGGLIKEYLANSVPNGPVETVIFSVNNYVEVVCYNPTRECILNIRKC